MPSFLAITRRLGQLDTCLTAICGVRAKVYRELATFGAGEERVEALEDRERQNTARERAQAVDIAMRGVGRTMVGDGSKMM
mmetsp:Transcript_15986/g.25323  ORF Transcript_15986/g.25323 Transcript_15986/m.25323 type:complete len:81 (+) Transcript_15986:622-864(+)